MASFKVKYRTRQKLQRAIQQEISLLGLVDTGALRSSIRISAVTGDLNQVTLTINCLYYYVFLDMGTQDIAPQNITEKALRSSNGRKFMEEVVQAYVNFLVEEYPILDVATIDIQPVVNLQYNTFGSEDPAYPNGIYSPNTVLRV